MSDYEEKLAVTFYFNIWNFFLGFFENYGMYIIIV